MKKVLSIIWIVVTTIMTVFTVMFFILWKKDNFALSALFAHETEISTVVLQHRLEDIGELATEKYYFSEMKNREDSLEFLDIDGWDMPWTSNSMIITFDGYVTAGISDFSEIDIAVNEKSEKIVVTLPEVEILGVSINHDSVDIYDIEDNVFNPIPVDAQVEMLEDAEEDVVDDALEDGILEKARDRLEEIIGSLIESMIEGTSYSDYSIKFEWK